VGKRSVWIIDKSEAVSRDGMVAAMQPLAAEAGAEILRQGGNAIDAAVATALAVGVVEPFMSGLGGIAFLTYRDATTGKTFGLDGSTVLPRAIRPGMFEVLPDGGRSGVYGWKATKDDAANTGWLTPGVPGMPALIGDAHRRFGRLPWKDLVQPAIRLAEEGYELNHYIAMMFSASYERLGQFPESRKTFFKPNGAPYAPAIGGPGDLFVQKDLARTLRLVAEQGPDVIYRGEIAQMIADDMARNGGLITMEDLAAHQTLSFEPYGMDYRGYQIYGQLPNNGYPTVLEALQILEGFDVAAMGFQSTEAVHVIIESLRRAFVDRLRYLGDAALMPVPMQGIVARDYAADRRATIDTGRATPGAEPGDPWKYDPTDSDWRPERDSGAGEGQTTHISVIDRDHNMVSLTSTLGGNFGSRVVIKDTGITLNNATMWFDPEPGSVTSIGPGKRTMSAASQILMLKDGKPFAATGSPGGRRVISAVYQIVVNMVDYGMSVQQAISAPRVHSEGRTTEISTRIPETVREALRDMGHELLEREESLSNNFFARPNGVMINQETGDLHGGAFPYTPATAVGV
jgi:gamma-glutamyltranspeptidase/glutathione hydrolase